MLPCPTCGIAVDPAVDPVRVIGGTVLAFCRKCAAEKVEQDEATRIANGEDRVFACRCSRTVPLWQAHTVVGASGIQLVCAACAHAGHPHAQPQPHPQPQAQPQPQPRAQPQPQPRAQPQPQPRRRRFASKRTVAAVAVAAAAGLAVFSMQRNHGASASAYIAPVPPEHALLRDTLRWPVAPPIAIEQAPPSDWVHPVVHPDRWTPTPAGSFGAYRDGRRPRECRRGHCGVDLHGPRGTPIVSVMDGTIDWIGKRRWRRSGLYVRVLHGDGSSTSYMHLDEIRSGLEVGDAVAAGEMLGTLGRTGIRTSPAHLHFAWKLPIGDRGWYADPWPALEGSATLSIDDVIDLDRDAMRRGIERRRKRLERRRKRIERRRKRLEQIIKRKRRRRRHRS